MSPLIGSYNQLLQTANNYLKDTELTDALLDEFIGVSEYEIQRDILSEEYGTGVPRQMLARATGTTAADSTYALPGDYHVARSVMVGGKIAKYVPPEKIASSAPGFAQADVVLDYYQRIEQLTASNPFNWLIQDGFDVYLWAVCSQYPLWGHHKEDLPMWRLKYEAAIRTLKRTYGAPPRGSNFVQSARPYNAFYTVIGSQILFGNLP